MLLFFCLSAWRWKGLYLYLGGRVLIKSVMNTIPTYMMSLFPIPKIVERKINPLAKNQMGLGKEPQLTHRLSIAEMVMEKVHCREIWATESLDYSVLKTITRIWPKFNTNMSIKLGDGMQENFWNEHW